MRSGIIFIRNKDPFDDALPLPISICLVPLMRHHPQSFWKQLDANAKQNIFPFTVDNLMGSARPGRCPT
jgi:hypothetical protein